MSKLLKTAAVLAILGGGTAWWLSRPIHADPSDFEGLTGDATHGEQVFLAAGCASCHMNEETKEKTVLTGGMELPSPFGSFVVPNISTDPEHGIGGWTVTEFATALQKGVSPEGQHYYPAFPYTSYTHMAAQDIVDLKAYMDTLPASAQENADHDMPFPFNIRRSLGLWKQLYLKDSYVVTNTPGSEIERGRYLVEAMGHCGECHTPRDQFGGLDRSAWLQGAPNPSGKGEIPGITRGILNWSKEDIAYYLSSGFTPDYDSAGGHMALVIENTSKLPNEDRDAIAAYLLALP